MEVAIIKSLLEAIQYLYICFIIRLGKLFKMMIPSQGDSALLIFTLKLDNMILKYQEVQRVENISKYGIRITTVNIL